MSLEHNGSFGAIIGVLWVDIRNNNTHRVAEGDRVGTTVGL